MTAVDGHINKILAEDMAERVDEKDSSREDAADRVDDTAVDVSPKSTRPMFPHKKSASIDSKASSYSGIHRMDSSSSTHPLSPPLPPASCNPSPDIHPLLLAATTRTESDDSIPGPHSDKREPCGIPNVVSPLTELSPNGGLTSGLGPSVMHTLSSSTSPYFAATPPRMPSASSSFSSIPTPNTSSAQTSPFHHVEFQNEVGMLQRRLSQDRRRRSSGLSSRRDGRERSGSIVAEGDEPSEESGRKGVDETNSGRNKSITGETNQRPDRSASVDMEESGTEHLRGARQELQSVLEEAIAEMPIRCEDGPFNHEAQEAVKDPNQTNAQEPCHESVHPSPHFSPVFSPVSVAQPNAPISFEDIVRHKRRGSVSMVGHSPSQSLSGSGPGSPAAYMTNSQVIGTSHDRLEGGNGTSRQTIVTNTPSKPTASSPLSSRRASASELTKMRRTFSGEDGRSYDDAGSASDNARVDKPEFGRTVRGAVAPASILQFLGNLEDADLITAAERQVGETNLEQVDEGLRESGLESSGSSGQPDYVVPGDGKHASEPDSADQGSANQSDSSPSSQSDSDNPHIPDTHLWDSVWPSTTSPPQVPTTTCVSFPKPMSDSRITLTPRLPMHSRTSSMSMSSISESTSPSPYSSPHQGKPMPMIHSLSFPRAHLSRPNESTAPAPAPSPYQRSGIPLFFSEALTQTTAPSWLQHPSARRGSIASLGTWPLKRENSAGAPVDVGASEKPHTIREEDGKDGKNAHDDETTMGLGGAGGDNTNDKR